MTTQLEDTFNIDGNDDDETVVTVYELEIPVDAKLSDISKLALDAYKMQMENIQHIEPQYRARSLEVAKQYLELAKAAIADDLKYQQSQEKLDRDKGSQGEKDGEEEDKDGEPNSGFSRHELLLALSKSGQKSNGQDEPEKDKAESSSG